MKPYDKAVLMAREFQAGKIYPINCVRIHNSKETMAHWIMKCLIAKGLTERKQQWMTEFDFRGNVCDVWNLTQDTILEVETQPSKQSVEKKKRQYKEHTDLFVFDLKDKKQFKKICDILDEFKDKLMEEMGL